MVSVHRYHEISESSHRILNPLSDEKVLLIGQICSLRGGSRQLDLASGKGEMLCRYAKEFGSGGVGIDIYPPFLTDARARADELGVEGLVEFVEGDASQPPEGPPFDVVSCIGATWIGGDLAGTLSLMVPRLAPGGFIAVGEVYWIEPPPPGVEQRHIGGQQFADLAGTLDVFEAAGLDLVEMVLANADDWDRYAASQWLNVSNWLAANPDDPDAADVKRDRDESRRAYLADERRCLGWGVFVLRP